jgi:hypothetical protein
MMEDRADLGNPAAGCQLPGSLENITWRSITLIPDGPVTEQNGLTIARISGYVFHLSG